MVFTFWIDDEIDFKTILVCIYQGEALGIIGEP